jgi:hypothetical protein
MSFGEAWVESDQMHLLDFHPRRDKRSSNSGHCMLETWGSLSPRHQFTPMSCSASSLACCARRKGLWPRDVNLVWSDADQRLGTLLTTVLYSIVLFLGVGGVHESAASASTASSLGRWCKVVLYPALEW